MRVQDSKPRRAGALLLVLAAVTSACDQGELPPLATRPSPGRLWHEDAYRLFAPAAAAREVSAAATRGGQTAPGRTAPGRTADTVLEDETVVLVVEIGSKMVGGELSADRWIVDGDRLARLAPPC